MNTIQRVIRYAAWLSIVAVVLVTLVPIGWRPATGLPPNIERFCVMAVVGALFAAAYPKRFWLIVLTLSLTAALVEPLQSLAAGRHPSFRDVEYKALGATMGAVFGYAAAALAELIARRTAPEAT